MSGYNDTMCVAPVLAATTTQQQQQQRKKKFDPIWDISQSLLPFLFFFWVSFLIYRRSKDDKDKPRYVRNARRPRRRRLLYIPYPITPPSWGFYGTERDALFLFPTICVVEEPVYLPLMSRRMTHSRARETLLCVLMGERERETLLLLLLLLPEHQQQASPFSKLPDL